MAGHYGHILKVAFSAFIANRAIMRVIGHQPFDDMFPKLYCFCVRYGDPLVVCNWFHTRHYKSSLPVVFILVNFYSTLTAGAHRSQCRMPAEIRQVKAKSKARFQEILSRFYVVRFVIYIERWHWPFIKIY
jgi:hypothetical protein